jgi:hypothetical protein
MKEFQETNKQEEERIIEKKGLFEKKKKKTKTHREIVLTFPSPRVLE